jgi:hypothetical protein
MPLRLAGVSPNSEATPHHDPGGLPWLLPTRRNSAVDCQCSTAERGRRIRVCFPLYGCMTWIDSHGDV